MMMSRFKRTVCRLLGLATGKENEYFEICECPTCKGPADDFGCCSPECKEGAAADAERTRYKKEVGI
jgi:hypothetical protein